ncbi:cytochrome P450 [Enemella sp. A6]|uniref:cytochrome P450 n=1 Tax=Enemella sp. A6 TaxID=3440152 RepID=UPI003EBB028D
MTEQATCPHSGAIYDPYAPEVMLAPRDTYLRMHEEAGMHFLPEYNAWAVNSFTALRAIGRDTKNFTAAAGSTPNHVLLGEPAPPTFASSSNEEHQRRRAILQPGYLHKAVVADSGMIREIARQVLDEVLVEKTSFDFFEDYTRKVSTWVAGVKAGIPVEDMPWLSERVDDFLARTPGQKGSSPENLEAIKEVAVYLRRIIDEDPGPEDREALSRLLEAVRDGKLTRDEAAADLHTLIVTGADTTEISTAATLYYLARTPRFLEEVRADPSLIPAAFEEAVRLDHPTDILCRQVLNDVEIDGYQLKKGQAVILMWGAAGLDPKQYPEPEKFDLHRPASRKMSFGIGPHICLGEKLARTMGEIMLTVFFEAVDEVTVHLDRCERRPAEFVKGFVRVPVTVVPKQRPSEGA